MASRTGTDVTTKQEVWLIRSFLTESSSEEYIYTDGWYSTRAAAQAVIQAMMKPLRTCTSGSLRSLAGKRMRRGPRSSP